jgi:SNF2 family DNA or RNA helicase
MGRNSKGIIMKTKAMAHQKVGLDLLLSHPDFYALGAEQGTGKTWMVLAEAEKRFGELEALLVVAPKGVHTNWVVREIPKHLSIPTIAESWASGASQKKLRKLNKLLLKNSECLIVLAINIDALNTKKGYEFAECFLATHKCMMIIDESQRIKNPKAKRTKKAIALGGLAYSRRILSGTLVSNSPLDLFSQFSFLKKGLLGTTSYRSFVSEYADLIPEHSALVQNIQAKSRYGIAPQVVKRNADGTPIFKNLDKLSKLMSPHTYRVLKSECLDLPEKIYKIIDFELSPAHMKHYNLVKEKQRWIRDNGEIDVFTALTVINKLQQITSGFILEDGLPARFTEGSQRMNLLKEIIQDIDGQIIIWARFREEIAAIVKELSGEYPLVEYHGGIKTADREKAVDFFQSGKAKLFVANAASAGTGLTLHAAETAIYFSSTYSLEERQQSEDRCHRIGTKRNVVYIDLVASGTIDERIAAALQSKKFVAAEILGNIKSV